MHTHPSTKHFNARRGDYDSKEGRDPMRRLRFRPCKMLLGLAACAAAVCGPLSAPALGAPVVSARQALKVTFNPIDFPGAAWTEPNGINRYGVLGHSVKIVGTYADITGKHGFVWSGGHYTALNVPNGYDTEAYGINGLNQIVGTYRGAAHGDQRGFIFQSGTYNSVPLCGPIGGIGTFAPVEIRGITNSGWMAENTVIPGAPEGLLFTLTNCFGLGPDDGTTETQIYGINNNGAVAGDYVDSSGIHGEIFSGPVINAPPPGPVNVPGASATLPRGINDSGTIAGYYLVAGLPEWWHRGFVDDNGSFTTIVYPGSKWTEVHGINDNDPSPVAGDGYDIVGTYGTDTNTPGHGFLATVSPVTNRCSSFCRR